MMEFQEKRKLKRFFYSKVILVGLLVLTFFLLIKVWDVYKKQDFTKNNLVKTAASLEGLRARERMLSLEIERLHTESGTEAEIRQKYGLVKPGEEVIVVVDNDDKDSGSDSTPIGFWQKIKDWLK